MTLLNLEQNRAFAQPPALLKRMTDALVWGIVETNIEPTEAMLAALTSAFCFVLRMNGTLFAAPAFEFLATVIDQRTLMVVSAALPALSFLAFAAGSFRLRRYAALGYVGLYSGIAAGVAVVTPYVPLVAFSVIFAVWSAWAYLRQRRQPARRGASV